jgi:hypothetical protein
MTPQSMGFSLPCNDDGHVLGYEPITAVVVPSVDHR